MGISPLYLSKDGKVTGPYTLGQIEELRQTGDLYHYSWMWDNKNKIWSAIEEELEMETLPQAPPPPPDAQLYVPPAPAPSRPISYHQPIERSHSKIPVNHTNPALTNATQSIHVICHNGHTIINGRLFDTSPRGCALESLMSAHSLPTFKVGSRVLLNLLNSDNGRSENTYATILETARNSDCWIYKLQWAKMPNILDEKKP